MRFVKLQSLSSGERKPYRSRFPPLPTRCFLPTYSRQLTRLHTSFFSVSFPSVLHLSLPFQVSPLSGRQ
ncbi:hypothetical protein L2E82_20071 [Cichorium intybus]|uniref:Uncharacterized protein n=1 Tax=Cichorium intybus TaxID=13427 RepID=A0ACB9DS08_CICIN|nr:hypothetical protein L2E82_20071 [Cichorium intybus]